MNLTFIYFALQGSHDTMNSDLIKRSHSKTMCTIASCRWINLRCDFRTIQKDESHSKCFSRLFKNAHRQCVQVFTTIELNLALFLHLMLVRKKRVMIILSFCLWNFLRIASIIIYLNKLLYCCCFQWVELMVPEMPAILINN